MKVSPPPLKAPMVDPKTGMISSAWYQFFNDIYRKTGEASNIAPISVEGTAESITGELPPEQLAGPVPISKGGTGAVDAAGAVVALGVQTVISPGTPGEVPVSNGTDWSSRRLNIDEIEGARKTQTKRGVDLVAVSGISTGAYADTTIEWDESFADDNYTLNVSVTPTVGVPIASIVSKSAYNCVVRITNATDAASDGTADVIGIHD